MGRDEQVGDRIEANITGPVGGQVGVGKGVHQSQQVGTMGIEVTEAECAELRQRFAELRAQVEAEVSQEQHQKALELVAELERDTIADRPKPSTMRYVLDWFADNVPKIGGTVAGVLTHPVVGRLVEAAGERVVAEFETLIANRG